MSVMINAVITGVDEVSFTIPIAPVTKKNHGRIVMCGRYPKLLPSEAYERYTKAAMPFLKVIHSFAKMIDSPVNLKCVFYLDKRRKSDLAGYLQAVQDLLVESGILADDNRNIVASVDGSAVLYDKANPRTEVTITRKENYEQWVSKNENK
ncbi:MAG: RusA family crossover junction endodeoxyribonuclease [Oscillospiraceae bacterium]|nr:RusA family crossover junction endodeoxyribonuclease [Oscillospiraceae bacterium]